MARRQLPDGWHAKLPSWSVGDDPVATRKALQKILGEIGPELPELWGGSADLAESNNTTIKGADSFGPSTVSTNLWGQMSPYGRTLHFGVREHAMGSILNGIALHGGTRVYGGTFLIFSDYMRPAVRLAALMKLPTTYIWTHDSIGLGEDGPTHQPIEQLSSLRAVPGLSIVRPADANETSAAIRTILDNPTGPAGLALTRQNLPILEGTDADGVARGGYVLAGRLGRAAPAGAHRHRLRGPARRRGPEGLRGRGRSHPRGEHALRRVVPGAGPLLHPSRHPAGRQGARLGRGRASRSPGTGSSATTASASRSSTSAPAPTTRPCSSSSGSPPSTWSRRGVARSPAPTRHSA